MLRRMQHENQRIESVSRFFCESAKLLGLLVDLIGIEPMTSSMPWKRAPSCATGPHWRVLLIVFYRTNFVKRGPQSCIFATKKGSAASGLKICLLPLARRYPWHASLSCSPPAKSLTHSSRAAPAAAPPPTIASSSIVQPALTEVQRSVSALNISRWKAPGQVKSAAQQDTGSIQRDLSDTLPGLLSKADAAPTTVPPAFVVFRNIDALYDVLLRVSQTASLAAPQGESDALFSSLNKLEAARSQLGDAILNASQQREDQVVKLEAAVRAAAAAQPQAPPPKTTVIDDGAAPPTPAKKRKKPAAKPPASTPPAGPTG